MKRIVFTLLSFFFYLLVPAQKTFIWCGTLIDGVDAEPRDGSKCMYTWNRDDAD